MQALGSSTPDGLHQHLKSAQQEWEDSSNSKSLIYYNHTGAVLEVQSGSYAAGNEAKNSEPETEQEIDENSLYGPSFEGFDDPGLVKSGIGKQKTVNNAQEKIIDEALRLLANFATLEDTINLYNRTESVLPEVSKPLETNQQNEADKAPRKPVETSKKREDGSIYHPRPNDLRQSGSLPLEKVVHIIAPSNIQTQEDQKVYQLQARLYSPKTKSTDDSRHEWVSVSGGAVLVRLIGGDGDCLFAAIRHQLITVLKPTNPPSIIDLRRQAADFLKKAKSDALVAETIRATAEQDLALRKDRSKKSLVDKYIDRLPRTKSFGGAESIYALSQVHEVAIHVYNELDQDFVIGEFPREIRICYRLTGGHHTKRLHYDSVVNVNMWEERIVPIVGPSSLPSYTQDIFKFKDYLTKVCPALKMLFDLVSFTTAAAAKMYHDYAREYRQIEGSPSPARQ